MGNKVTCCSSNNHEDDPDKNIKEPNLFDEEDFSDYEDE